MLMIPVLQKLRFFIPHPTVRLAFLTLILLLLSEVKDLRVESHT